MKQDNYDDYESLNDMAEDLPYSKERSLLREKALKIADILNDEQKQFEARINYINDVCSEGSFPEKYLTVFPWLLSYIGKNKESEDTMTVLWYYKWVIMIMHEFSSISKEQIENALEDLRKKYTECGSTDKVFHDYSREAYHNLGDYEKSAFHHEKHSTFKKKDQLDDCEACVLNRIVTFYIITGNIDEALKRARPILTFKKTCTHIPKDTYTNLITPLLIQKKYDLASDFAEKLEKALKKSNYGGNITNVYPLILNHCVHSRISNAVKLFEKYFGHVLLAKSPERKFNFYCAAVNMFKKVEKTTIKLRLPQDFPLFNKDNVYEITALIEWLEEESGKIAAVFDKRNGNDKYKKEKLKLLSIN
jgi:hypothetical protein